MAARFYRVGKTAQLAGPNLASPNVLAPVPAGADDSQGYSNLNVNADSDPIPLVGYDTASVTLYSDTTCVASLQAFVGPTATGPWTGVGSASANPSLAAPILVNPLAGGPVGFVKVTTTGYASGNPRAILTARRANGTGIL